MEEKNNLEPRKDYYEPMHTAEHILNQTMIRMFQCGRSFNAHIERKKSKCDYHFNRDLTADEIFEIEKRVNEVIDKHVPVTELFVSREEAEKVADLSKLPDRAGDELRLIRVGDYDVCACIGAHVQNTSEIGEFKITTHSFEGGVLRLRYKLS